MIIKSLNICWLGKKKDEKYRIASEIFFENKKDEKRILFARLVAKELLEFFI